jgi:hypothetical protein
MHTKIDDSLKKKLRLNWQKKKKIHNSKVTLEFVFNFILN